MTLKTVASFHGRPLVRVLLITAALMLVILVAVTIRPRVNANVNDIQMDDRTMKTTTMTRHKIDLRFLRTLCPKSDSSVHLQMYQICECPRARRPLLVPTTSDGRVVVSSCDDHATARGANQMVVSYSFYGHLGSNYFEGILYNVRAVARMYPNWTMRLYHNLNMANDRASAALCHLWCNNDHLDLCQVQALPPDLYDMSHIFGTLWRFFVLGDPLVARFMIRDVDSDIIQREVDSVNVWIADGRTWHVMRDHLYHATPILAGMWGGTNDNMTLTTRMREEFIDNGNTTNKHQDQTLLQTVVWPIIQNDMMSHDSHYCQVFKGSQPWPTRRTSQDFVGNKFPWHDRRQFHAEICPKQCRPVDHQDWTYC